MKSLQGPILAGDVGGTKTNLALYREAGGTLERIDFRTFRSREYPGLGRIVSEFLAGRPPVRIACVGVAGPVVEGRSRVTNLPWVVEQGALAEAVGARTLLINDLQATAFAVPFLPAESLAPLRAGTPRPRGTIGVIAAGTGLGQAFLVWGAGEYRPFPSEGGHVEFAPRDAREARLLGYLEARHGGRASVERAVSGPGLLAIYRFLRESEGWEERPEVEPLAAGRGAPKEIARAALEGRSETCRESLRLFCSLYGSAAGNLALQVMATGGIYLGGGIAPAILPALADGNFAEAFVAKGRFREFLSEIPVQVIRDDRAALLGCAQCALRAQEEGA